ncbi:MAG TPA: PEGA domain-containing protein [Polyangiales bacterium]|nr:PEGA domain-containing protein [Polyangiales bacterium]
MNEARSARVRRCWLHRTLLLLFALLTAAATARAEDAPPSGGAAQAAAHFDRGVRFYEEGDYRSALLEFKRAYAVRPAFQLLFNLGQVSSELRDYASAEDYYRRYLNDGKDAVPPERRAEVTAELANLSARVGALRITSNVSGAAIRIDDKPIPDALGKVVRVSAGQRQLVAEKAGYAPVQRAVDVLGGEEVKVALEFGPPLAQVEAAASKSSTNLLPWITGIGSAALLISGSIMAYAAYGDAQNYGDELNRLTTQAELDRLSSQTQNKALAADILLGLGIAGAAVTVVLVLTSQGGEQAPTTAGAVTLDARGARIQF